MDKFSTKLLPSYRSIYCRVELNKTPDVSAANARRDHRKSKFGLRHDAQHKAQLALMHKYFFRKFTKSRARPPRGRNAPVPFRSPVQYTY
jgi:hypothetical protein